MRRTDQLGVKLCAAVILLMLTSCSLYESSGRKIIETNQNDAVGVFGFNSRHTLQYNCSASRQIPEFMHAPLEVLSTPYEAEGMTVLLDEQSQPAFLAIEKAVQPNTYLSCKVKFIKQNFAKPELSVAEISAAVRLGHDQIAGMMARLTSSNQTGSRF